MRRRSLVLCLIVLAAGCEKTVYVGSPVDTGGDTSRLDARAERRSGETARTIGWAVPVGGPGEDLVKAIALDRQGNLLVSGVYTGEVRFGDLTLAAAPAGRGVFVAKLTPGGSFSWVAPLDAVASSEAPDGLAVDGEGDVYYSGAFTGTATFGQETRTSKGAEDILLVKLGGASGRLLRVATAGGPGRERANRLAVDAAGSITLCGFFEGSAAFDRVTLDAQGSSDLFVTRLDPDGNVSWAVRAGSPSPLRETASGLAVDDAGAAYVTGSFAGAASFGSLTLEATTEQLFVAKLDGSGAFLSAAAPALADATRGRDLTLAGRGKLYLGGAREAAGMARPLLARVEGSKFLWTSLLAGAGDESPGWVSALVADGSGAVIAAGGFKGSRQMGSTLLASQGEEDVFVTRLDPTGAVVWATRAGGPAGDTATGLALDASGNLYVTGAFRSTARLDAHALSSRGESDGFIWRTRAPE